MQITLAPEYADTPAGRDAQAMLRQCVHCGFCTATCPTYQLFGDELDGPRGRIYLIKQVLEGQPPTRRTQRHLDRCLICRNCESTCPSGVPYGRQLVDAKVTRPAPERALRWLLKQGLPSPLFAPAIRLGQALRPLLPVTLKARLPAPGPARLALTGKPGQGWPVRKHPRQMLMLRGCVQPALAPNIDAATARVLDAAGIQAVLAPKAGCCGALGWHLGDPDGSRAQMRTNIDAWWPWIETGSVEAIVINASGCGVMVKDYGHALKDDPAYAAKAARVAALARDVSELLPDWVATFKGRLRVPPGVWAWHPPCTLQHGQQLRGGVEQHLGDLGFALQPAAQDSHLCCGAAGAYSVFNPDISNSLRQRKLGHLLDATPQGAPVQGVVSANIGCIAHLQSGTTVTVCHWIELLDAALNRL